MVKTLSACNSGDLDSIPGSGRSPGEGNGYPLQYSKVYCYKGFSRVYLLDTKTAGMYTDILTDHALFTCLIMH